MKLKIGDRVRLSELGKSTWYNEQSNPHEGEGIVEDIEGPDCPEFVEGLEVYVQWKPSYPGELVSNFYHEDHLDLIEGKN